MFLCAFVRQTPSCLKPTRKTYRELWSPRGHTPELFINISLFYCLYLQNSHSNHSPISKHASHTSPTSISDDRNDTPKILDPNTRIRSQGVLVYPKTHAAQTCSEEILVGMKAYARTNGISAVILSAQFFVPRDGDGSLRDNARGIRASDGLSLLKF